MDLPLKYIEQEVHMLQKVTGPHIVKLHDVFFDGVSVSLVMDVHKGGSLMKGMERHWKTTGMIPVPTVLRLAAMMTEAVQWIHGLDIVHRDLKPENFVLDREEIEDSDCQVTLCDFGTTCSLAPVQRLTKQVGTCAFWAPEIHKKNYGLPVDAWALGVIVYGLVTSNFPCKGRLLIDGLSLTSEGVDFVQGLLMQEEDQRFTP